MGKSTKTTKSKHAYYVDYWISGYVLATSKKNAEEICKSKTIDELSQFLHIPVLQAICKKEPNMDAIVNNQ